MSDGQMPQLPGMSGAGADLMSDYQSRMPEVPAGGLGLGPQYANLFGGGGRAPGPMPMTPPMPSMPQMPTGGTPWQAMLGGSLGSAGGGASPLPFGMPTPSPLGTGGAGLAGLFGGAGAGGPRTTQPVPPWLSGLPRVGGARAVSPYGGRPGTIRDINDDQIGSAMGSLGRLANQRPPRPSALSRPPAGPRRPAEPGIGRRG